MTVVDQEIVNWSLDVCVCVCARAYFSDWIEHITTASVVRFSV